MVQLENAPLALSFSNRRDEAIRLYTELLATRPKNSDLLLARGRTYAWENRWNESEADLTAVATQAPDYGDAWSALGDMYMWSDRPTEAVNAVEKLINRDKVVAVLGGFYNPNYDPIASGPRHWYQGDLNFDGIAPRGSSHLHRDFAFGGKLDRVGE